MAWRLDVLLIVCVGFSLVSSQEVQLVNNGYENVLIAISDAVPEDSRLIPRIKEVFNEASAVLFKATGYRAYFRDVTIMVPSSWNIAEVQPATTQSFDKANIRIDEPSSRHGITPYVRQPATCGKPGEFMHLTPGFLLDQTASVRRFGPTGKVVVHEWGHLRWGLFDEYPRRGSDITERFYNSPTTNTLEATRCNVNVRGEMVNSNSYQPCRLDPNTLLPEQDCIFDIDNTQSIETASMMYKQFIPGVVGFCDDGESGANFVHNYEAPSFHNRMCAGRSSWAVMRESPDFSGGSNPAIDSSQNTDVTFTVVQRKDNRIVIVMDVSGSMNSDNRLTKMRAAALRYLRYTVPAGARVGLVRFNGGAYALTGSLYEIMTEADREYLVSRVPTYAGGGTSIGSGLYRAMEILAASGDDSSGSRIILLTDGQDSNEGYLASVLSSVIAAGITVDTILLSEAASNYLVSLAAETGGQSFYSSGDDASTSLNDAFTASERARISNPRDVPITVISRVLTVDAYNETCHNVTIDSALGRDTTFTFSWVSTTQITTIHILNGNTNVTAAISGQSAAYKCDGQCTTGRWTVCLRNVGYTEEKVLFQLESSARQLGGIDNTRDAINFVPITVQTSIVNKEPDFDNVGREPVLIFASVTRGYDPVVAASVVATVEYPSSGGLPPIKLVMRDDGAGADIYKGDGTYSAFILNSDATGKHTVSVEVVNQEETKVKTSEMFSSSDFIIERGVDFDVLEEILMPSGDFQRYSLAGYIDVKSVAPLGADVYPPSKIIDLKVTNTSYEENSVVLQWTSVGDDLDEGQASLYELWRADSYKVLYIAREENATLVNSSEIIEGNLSSPLPAYRTERLKIRVPDREKVFVYALIAKDDGGNPSELSNIVSTKLVYVPPTTEPPVQAGMSKAPSPAIIVVLVAALIYPNLF